MNHSDFPAFPSIWIEFPSGAPPLPYLLLDCCLFCCLKIRTPFHHLPYFFLCFVLLSSGSLPSSCSLSHAIFYREIAKMPRNGINRCSVRGVFRCLTENFHTGHDNFKTIWLILHLQNYEKPLEQQEKKIIRNWHVSLVQAKVDHLYFKIKKLQRN